MSAYGLWSLVLINSAIFILFAFSFTRPRINSDWRSFGVFSAFIVSMFTEMYGFPLPIYLLSGWLGERFPLLDLFSHSSGHLWHTLFGMKGDPHLDPFHILSKLLIFGGFIFLAAAWEKLYRAQREHTRATTGAYACVRHPQYGAFIVIIFGFLLQWPTLLTLLMFPVLVWMYVRLPLGHNLRMAAFGSIQEGVSRPYLTISLTHVLRFLREYIRQNWEYVGHAQFKDPVFGFLVTLERATRGDMIQPLQK